MDVPVITLAPSIVIDVETIANTFTLDSSITGDTRLLQTKGPTATSLTTLSDARHHQSAGFESNVAEDTRMLGTNDVRLTENLTGQLATPTPTAQTRWRLDVLDYYGCPSTALLTQEQFAQMNTRYI